jgi:hypothetical protein
VAVAEAARKVADHPHVQLVYTTVGGGTAGTDPFAQAGAPEARKATLTLNLTPRQQRRGVTKQAIERELRERMEPTCRARVCASASAARPRSTSWCWPARTANCWRSTPPRSSSELRGLSGIGG